MTTKEKKIKLIEPVVGQDELQMIRKVLESGWLTEGLVTEEFEEEVKKFVGGIWWHWHRSSVLSTPPT